LVGSGRHFLINLARTLFGGFETVTESQKKRSDHENDDTTDTMAFSWRSFI